MAHLIPALIVDLRQWAVVVRSLADLFARSGRFVIQRLSDAPRDRVCYKLVHKYPSLNASRATMIVDHYLERSIGAERI